MNLGDTYNSHSAKSKNVGGFEGKQMRNNKAYSESKIVIKKTGVADKSLCLIPQRFAIEMVNRGWILRNVIIWKKPNCMPSSAKDRFTVDFEYVYFFVKSKKYWFEQQFDEGCHRSSGLKNPVKGATEKGFEIRAGLHKIANKIMDNRNKRAVWTISTKPFKEAHFAVFPEALIETPIQAGCPKYVCKKCGKARVKMYEKGELISSGPNKMAIKPRGFAQNTLVKQNLPKDPYGDLPRRELKEIGYTDCGCNAGFEGGVVMDIFMGSGTTARVAKKQGKQYLGIELKQEYIDMAEKRIRKIGELLF